MPLLPIARPQAAVIFKPETLACSRLSGGVSAEAMDILSRARVRPAVDTTYLNGITMTTSPLASSQQPVSRLYSHKRNCGPWWFFACR
jgi:hypothetical protein